MKYLVQSRIKIFGSEKSSYNLLRHVFDLLGCIWFFGTAGEDLKEKYSISNSETEKIDLCIQIVEHYRGVGLNLDSFERYGLELKDLSEKVENEKGLLSA